MRGSPKRRAARALLGVAVLSLLMGSGCSSAKKKRQAATYDPAESVTEVVAVLRRHIPDDTYRFEPAVDFTGRNVYRASLLRLENMEQVHADALRSGYLDAVMAFSKGRALERLRAFDLAAQQYRDAARKSGELREEALRSAGICEATFAASKIGIDLRDPLAEEGPLEPLSLDTDWVIGELDARIGEFLAIAQGIEESENEDEHYQYVIREEIERADVTRARYFVGLRHVIEGGQVRAVSELQRVVTRHSASKKRRRHVLDLANLYAALATEYAIAIPPESLLFDPPRFQELVDAAAQLYESVAAQDGTTEKIEAARRLEAFLAFTLQVDRDRFGN
ncbi:MAG: hypothetical protein JRG96_14760 [Deltaproteobacteria bacterium]|nr:hypothetical protein [Deltaproteobacteria bacterium]